MFQTNQVQKGVSFSHSNFDLWVSLGWFSIFVLRQFVPSVDNESVQKKSSCFAPMPTCPLHFILFEHVSHCQRRVNATQKFSGDTVAMGWDKRKHRIFDGWFEAMVIKSEDLIAFWSGGKRSVFLLGFGISFLTEAIPKSKFEWYIFD